MSTNPNILATRLARHLVPSKVTSRLILIGPWHHLNSADADSPVQQWDRCFESVEEIDVDNGPSYNDSSISRPGLGNHSYTNSTRELATSRWFAEVNQVSISGSPSDTKRRTNEQILVAVCRLVSTDPSTELTYQPAEIQIAIQSSNGTAEAILEFLPIWGGSPSWTLVGRAVFQLIEMIANRKRTVWSDFDPSCRLSFNVGIAKKPWVNVLTGRDSKTIVRERVALPEENSIGTAETDLQPTALGHLDSHSNRERQQAILSGSFNPLHQGHLLMAAYAREQLGLDVSFELSVLNADKPPLDFIQLKHRVSQEFQGVQVWLTGAATFDRKSKLFPGAIFLVGADTIVRIGDRRFYGDSEKLMIQNLEYIAIQGCRFLVFGRIDESRNFKALGNIELPELLLGLCDEVSEVDFRADISSTELRTS